MSTSGNSHGCRQSISGLTVAALLLLMSFNDESNSAYGGGWNRSEFIAYTDTMQSSVDSLEFDLGSPRSHPSNGWRLTNKNGNLSLTDSELNTLNLLPGVEIIESDSIENYLQENGWNEGGGE